MPLPIPRRWRSFGAKLTVLVVTPVAVMAVALPFLSSALRGRVVARVDHRVESAADAFGQELRDDLDDLTLSAKVIAADGDTARFIQQKDARGVAELARIFHSVYPTLDVLLAAADGEVVAHVGGDHPLGRLQDSPPLTAALRGEPFRGLTEHGCEGAADAPAAYVVALPVTTPEHAVAGAVVACLPIDAANLANAGAKLGVELGLAGDGPGILAHTAGFPPVDAAGLGRHVTLVTSGGRTFAMTVFAPPELRAAVPGGAERRLVAAMEVSGIRHLVGRHLLSALGALALITVVAVAFGVGLARSLAGAIGRLGDGMKRLKRREYAHVEGVDTGDELTDLARAFNVMVDGLQERDRLHATFDKYMTPSVREHILKGRVTLGGETLTVTVLFSDIRSFSTLSERMPPKDVVALLNEYFSEMVRAVTSEDGVVDKYIGDAIMVVFGAPVPKSDDALRAVRAAVKMRRGLVRLNARLEARGLAPLATGIGLHTGVVVAGNIGSEARMEYTVIGDTVNLASRLEGATKEVGVPVLMSAATWALVKGQIEARPVRELSVKGRRQPVMTYEVLGIKGEAEEGA